MKSHRSVEAVYTYTHTQPLNNNGVVFHTQNNKVKLRQGRCTN